MICKFVYFKNKPFILSFEFYFVHVFYVFIFMFGHKKWEYKD